MDSVVSPDMHVMSELALMSSWRRSAGALDRKVCAFVAVACAVTLAVSLLGPRWFWGAYGDGRVGTFWIRNGLGLLAGAVLAGALIIRGTSPALRLAMALPLAHLAVIAATWSAWSHLAPRLADARHNAPILGALPMAPVLLGALALFAIVGRLASRRDPLQGMLTMSLAALLAVGLWLPIACAWYGRGMHSRFYAWDQIAAQNPYRIAAFVLVPPLCAAIGFTLMPARLRWIGPAAVTCAFALALATRLEPSLVALMMYGNFVHILLALTIAAVSSIGLLGLALLARARRASRMLRDVRTGRIECDGTAILLAIPGWLRGPELMNQAFTIRTAHHTLVVPAGIAIVSPVPLLTTQLRDGEALELARAGDQVVVGGFVDPDPDHPFRSLTAPQPGPDGLVVARAGKTTFGDVDVALSLWRPSVAYLVIAVAVALPGLLTALTMK